MPKIVLLLFFLVNFSAVGQDTASPTFSDVHLEKVKEDLQYDKTKRALVPRNERKAKEPVVKEEKVKKPMTVPVPGSLFAYVLIGILLSIILYYLGVALVSRKNQLNPGNDDDLDDIDQIEDKDLDSLLSKKLSEENYRLAFRIQFLKLLQTLAQKNMIIWQPNKTNGTYVRECESGVIKQRFKAVSRVFDHTWYGNSEITEEDYHLIKSYVADLQLKIEAIHE